MMAEDGIHQRRIRVQTLQSKGYNINAIASAVGAHRNTVRSDLRSMNTGRFTVINDHDLDEILAIFFLHGTNSRKDHGTNSRKDHGKTYFVGVVVVVVTHKYDETMRFWLARQIGSFLIFIFFFTGRTHEKTTGPTHKKTTDLSFCCCANGARHKPRAF